MRQLRVVTALVLLAGVTAQGVVSADSREQGQTVDLTVQLNALFSAPAEHWANPCESNGDDYPYVHYKSREMLIPAYLDENTDIVLWKGATTSEAGEKIAQFGKDVFRTHVRTHTRYESFCYSPDGEIDEESMRRFWMPLVTQETVVSELYKHVWDYVQPPTVWWPSMDREFGWLYVNAPMDFRLEPLTGVSLNATVANPTTLGLPGGAVSANVTVEPGTVTLVPGEPRGEPVVCSMDDALAGYSVARPGACSYRYKDSSAISPIGTFEALAQVEWSVETTDPSFPVDTIETWSSFDVAVAEAQAVVTG